VGFFTGFDSLSVRELGWVRQVKPAVYRTDQWRLRTFGHEAKKSESHVNYSPSLASHRHASQTATASHEQHGMRGERGENTPKTFGCVMLENNVYCEANKLVLKTKARKKGGAESEDLSLDEDLL